MQTRIPGTERKDHPEIEEIALELNRAKRKQKTENKKLLEEVSAKEFEMGVRLKTAKVKRYKFWDPDIERYCFATIKVGDEKYEIEITDEGPTAQVGMAVVANSEGGKADVPKGLIDQAMADSNTNTEVDDEGDVVVPEKSTPKAKRGSKKKS